VISWRAVFSSIALVLIGPLKARAQEPERTYRFGTLYASPRNGIRADPAADRRHRRDEKLKEAGVLKTLTSVAGALALVVFAGLTAR
jgi:hypothetical protein